MNPANLTQFGQLATQPLTDQENKADGEPDFELVPVCLVDAVQGRDYHRQVAQRIPCEQRGWGQMASPSGFLYKETPYE